jgi:hypothetical protein
VSLGCLEGVGPPDGGSGHGLEPVRAAEGGEPRRAEGKEDCGRIAEWHTARDAECLTSGADGDGGHVAEKELRLAPARPDYLETGRRRHPARLLEDVHDTQPEVGAVLIQSRSRAEQVIRDLLSDG